MKHTLRIFSIVTTLTILFALFYLLYSGSLDFLTYDKYGGIWVTAVILLVGIPVAFSFTFKAIFKSNSMKSVGSLIGVLSILINGPYYGYWSGKHEETCYGKHGVKTIGTVTNAFYDYDDGHRMYYEFDVNGIIYTSFNVSNPLQHISGDTIHIIYNAKNPEMNEALVSLGR